MLGRQEAKQLLPRVDALESINSDADSFVEVWELLKGLDAETTAKEQSEFWKQQGRFPIVTNALEDLFSLCEAWQKKKRLAWGYKSQDFGFITKIAQDIKIVWSLKGGNAKSQSSTGTAGEIDIDKRIEQSKKLHGLVLKMTEWKMGSNTDRT